MKGRLVVLSQDDQLNYEVRLEVMRSGLNRNNWDYQNIAQYAQTFRGTPILCAVVNGEWGDGHNTREETDPITGVTTYSFTDDTAERIVGCIYDTNDAVWTEEKEDGETWVYARGKLWRFYCAELVDDIASRGSAEVSAETLVSEAQDGEDGREVFTAWQGIGVTILGSHVAPAVPGAMVKAASYEAMKQEFESLKLKAASLYNKPQAEENDQKETVLKMNKQVLKAAQALMPEGYTVLAANGSNYCVCHDGMAQTIELVEGAFDAEKLNYCPLNAVITLGDAEVEVDVNSVMETMHNEAVKLSEQLEAEKAVSAALQVEIDRMKQEESIRRVEAAKAAVNAAFEEATLYMPDGSYDANARDAIIADIDNGVYTNQVNADGKWIGDANAVMALNAKLQEMSIAQAKAKAKAQLSVNNWAAYRDSVDNGSSGDVLADAIKLAKS